MCSGSIEKSRSVERESVQEHVVLERRLRNRLQKNLARKYLIEQFQ